MSKTVSQRDAFWNRVFRSAKNDRNIVVVAADMGAPSLDRFRKELGFQFIDVGIAEQQAIAVAAGLALAGKKVFAYAIAPFITLRCYEQIRVDLAGMNIPVTLVGVGSGFSYEDSGPTHHAIEDISVMRILPNVRVHNMTDSVMAAAFGELSCTLPYPNYVRLDRHVLPTLYAEGHDFTAGLSVLKPGTETFLIATGSMVHKALAFARELKPRFPELGVIDIYTLPIPEKPFLTALRNAKRLVTLEEHTLPGGLGSAVCEVLADHGLRIPVKRIGLTFRESYCYRYGGRENILSFCGLGRKDLLGIISKFLSQH